MKSLDPVKHAHQRDCIQWNTKVGREVGEEANLLLKPPSWSLWSIPAAYRHYSKGVVESGGGGSYPGLLLTLLVDSPERCPSSG